MHGKKRLSKRISTRKREKINKKVRLHHKELKKEERKKRKIPKAILLTQEEKDHLQSIKEATEIRNKEFLKNKKIVDDKELELINEYLNFDIFIEMIDHRDILESRFLNIETHLLNEKKSLYCYNDLDLQFRIIFNNEEQNKIDFSDPVQLDLSNKSILIFGAKKSGKFLLSKNITNNFQNTNIKLLEIPVTKITPSNVFRGIIDENLYDPLVIFYNIFDDLDKLKLRNFYELDNFTNKETFLINLGNKITNKNFKNQKIAAMKFITDVLNKKILWKKDENNFIFEFSNK